MYTPPLTGFISTNGKNKGGMRYFLFCPIEWLAAEVQIDPIQRTVNVPVSLLPGRALLRGKCLADSAGLSETPATSKSGDFREYKLPGIVNLDEVQKSILFDTLRFHKMLVIYYDKNGNVKIIGNHKQGMDFSSGTQHEPATAGKTYYEITLTHQTEHPAPFYTV